MNNCFFGSLKESQNDLIYMIMAKGATLMCMRHASNFHQVHKVNTFLHFTRQCGEHFSGMVVTFSIIYFKFLWISVCEELLKLVHFDVDIFKMSFFLKLSIYQQLFIVHST